MFSNTNDDELNDERSPLVSKKPTPSYSQPNSNNNNNNSLENSNNNDNNNNNNNNNTSSNVSLIEDPIGYFQVKKNQKYLKIFGIIIVVVIVLCSLARFYHTQNNIASDTTTGTVNSDSSLLSPLRSIHNHDKYSNSKKQIHPHTSKSINNNDDISYSDIALDDLIYDLPGLNDEISFKQFSGYLDITKSTNNRKLFYWFFESQNDVLNDPLVIWTNGGPGCSSLVGLFTENGPFWIQEDGSLELNDYSWNKYANMLYVEQPCGVGFGKSDDDSYITGDKESAEDFDNAIRSFLTKFDVFANSNVYLSGESYAGHYVPMTTLTILQNNEDSENYSPYINLKGFLVGNPYTDPYENDMGIMSALYGHGLMKADTFQSWMNKCYGKDAQIIEDSVCSGLMTTAFYDVLFDNINFYALDYDDCYSFSLTTDDTSICSSISSNLKSDDNVNTNGNYVEKVVSNNELFPDAKQKYVDFDSRYGSRNKMPLHLEKWWYNKIKHEMESHKDTYDDDFRVRLEMEQLYLEEHGYGRYINNDDNKFEMSNNIDNGNGYFIHPHDPVNERKLLGLNDMETSASSYISCSDEYLFCYMNTYEVQKAIHVLDDDATEDDIVSWELCNLEVNTNWPTSDHDGTYIEDVYDQIIQWFNVYSISDFHILVYSGDNDAVCATEGTLYWMNNKMSKIYSIDSSNDFVSWEMDDEQVGGYYTKYLNSDYSNTAWHFTTVRSAGHMVPSTQPGKALQVLYKFLNEWTD